MKSITCMAGSISTVWTRDRSRLSRTLTGTGRTSRWRMLWLRFGKYSGEGIEVCASIEVIDTFGSFQKIDHPICKWRSQHLVRHFEHITTRNQLEDHT